MLENAEKLRAEAELWTAESAYQEALSAALATGDREVEAAARQALAKASVFDRFQALAQYRLALQRYRELGNRRGEAATLHGMGSVYTGTGFASKALEVLSEALKIERDLSDRKAEIETLTLLGLAYQTRGSLEDAHEHLEQAAELAKTGTAQPSQLVGTLLHLARLEMRLGRYAEAVPHLREAIEVLDHDAPADPIGDFVRGVATIASVPDVNPFEKALRPEEQPLPDEALRRAKLEILVEELEERVERESGPSDASPEPNQEAVRRMQFLEALGLREAREIRKRWRSTIAAELQQQISENHVEAGDMLWSYILSDWLEREAVKLDREILASGRVTSLPPGWFAEQAAELRELLTREGLTASFSRESLAKRFAAPDENDPGIPAVEDHIPASKDRELARQIRLYLKDQSQSTQSATLRDFLANFFTLSGFESRINRSISSALQPLNTRDPGFRDFGRAISYCWCAMAAYNLLGMAYSALDARDEAAHSYARAWELYAGTWLPSALPGEQFDPAREALRATLAAQRAGLPAPWTGHCLDAGEPAGFLPLQTPALSTLWQAEWAAARNDYDFALFHFHDALSTGNAEARITALMRIGDIFMQQGRKAQALRSWWSAIDAVEEMQSALSIEHLAAPFVGTQIPLYERTVRLLATLGGTELAFDDAERAHARVFLNQMGNRRTPLRRIPTELAGAWDDARQRLAELDSRRLALQQSRSRNSPLTLRQLAAVASAQDAARTRFEALRNRIKRLDPESAAFTGIDPVTLREVQTTLLEPDTTLLEYLVLQDRTIIWAVDREHCHLVEVPTGAEELNRQVRLLRGAITAHQPSLEIAARLYSELFAPIAPFVRSRNLIIVPHGALHYLPFAGLWNPAGGGRPMAQDYTITLVPSASVLRLLLKRRNAFAGQVLVLGNPDSSLPAAAKEAQAIASLFGTVPLLGNEATETRIRQAAPRSDILHFATHATFDPVHSLFTRIELASGTDPKDERTDGLLHVHEIYDLNLTQANVVVLSACQTAIGKRSAGDEIVSLNRAFLFAGAPAVVASLWSVDDDASSALMTSFYCHWRKGKTAAAALRAAQLEIRSHEEWEAPWYWAGFMLTGDPEARIEALPEGSLVLLVLYGSILVLAILAAAMILRRREALRRRV